MNGKSEYINKNCWLVRTLNYAPYKRCQYCELRFPNCLFLHFQIISVALIVFFITLSFLIEKNFSELLIVALFTLVIVYGYFFNKNTDKIIKANFSEREAKESLEELTENLQEKVDAQTKELKERKEEAEKVAHKESLLRREAEDLAGEKESLAEEFQIVAIKATAFKNQAQEQARIEKVLREKSEKIAREHRQLNAIRNNMFLTGHHHSRTPLAHIKNFSAMLLDGDYGALNKEQKAIIKIILNKAQESIELANLYLKVSELEAGKAIISKKKTDLEKLVRSQIKKLSYDAKTKNIQIRAEIEPNLPKVKVDLDKIATAYYTIIDNAIKYTTQEQSEIIVGLKKRGQGAIVFFCQDSGIGVEKEKLQDIGKIAYNRMDEARGVHGTGKGLGLYLSTLIVKAHNGQIWAESEGRGKGTTFYLELPIK